MSTGAETTQVKRLLSDLLPADDGGENSPSKRRQRVRFHDNDDVNSSGKISEEDDSLMDIDQEEEDVDFVLSIGEDGDWDYTIITATKDVPLSCQRGAEPAPCRKTRTASPFAGCDRRLHEELYTMPSSSNVDSYDEHEGLLRVNSNSSLGNNLKISIKKCNDSSLDASAADAISMPPLITPPSSPRRIRTVCLDGVTTEEATICEWPCNLAVDNAITAAFEWAPQLSLPTL